MNRDEAIYKSKEFAEFLDESFSVLRTEAKCEMIFGDAEEAIYQFKEDSNFYNPEDFENYPEVE